MFDGGIQAPKLRVVPLEAPCLRDHEYFGPVNIDGNIIIELSYESWTYEYKSAFFVLVSCWS